MPRPSELHAASIEGPDGEIHEATILDNASTPSDEVRCITPSEGNRLTTDPAQWMPFVKPDGIYYPKKDDRAIVSYHEDGPTVIVAWWPSASDPDHAF